MSTPDRGHPVHPQDSPHPPILPPTHPSVRPSVIITHSSWVLRRAGVYPGRTLLTSSERRILSTCMIHL
ncbi:hypothetical protein GN956_G24750 [Arapaima gigas]